MGATLADGGVNPCTGEQVVARDVSQHACGNDDGRALRDLGRLALRHRVVRARAESAAGSSTVAPGKGGLGMFSPLLDYCREQRAGPARRAIPLARAGTRPVRVETRSMRRRRVRIGTARSSACCARRSSGDRDRRSGDEQALAESSRRSSGSSSSRTSADTASRTSRPTSICSSAADSRAARAVEPHRPREDRACRARTSSTASSTTSTSRAIRSTRAATTVAGRSGSPQGSEPTVYAHVAHRARVPGEGRAPVLALLPVQRLQQHARRRLGDDPARLRRGRCRGGARHGSRSRSDTARTRAPSAPRGMTTSSTSSTGPTGRLSGCRLARQQVQRSTLARQLGGGGRGLRRHARSPPELSRAW